MQAKIKFAADNLNRLIIKRGLKESPVEGEFKVEKNDLVFEPYRKLPLATALNLPRSIKFEGSWHLNKNHNLELHLKETRSKETPDVLELKGKILSCEADKLVFQMRCRKTPDEDRISLLCLNGSWQADRFGRLIFLVSRDRDSDTLKFNSGWQVNENYKLVYKYEKEGPEYKGRTTEYLEFDGRWQIDNRKEINYLIDLKNNSFFRFKADVEAVSFQDKAAIKFCLGAGVKKQARETVISLLGRWRIKERGGISFEVDYGGGCIYAMDFTAEAYIGRDKKIVFELKNRKGESLGLTVSFERNFFKNSTRVFARLAKLDGESRIEAGIKIIW